MKALITTLIIAVCININAQVCFTSTNYPAIEGSTSIAYADFTADGKLDLAVTQYGSTSIFILPGNGLGGFGAANIVNLDTSMISNLFLRCIISRDFNKDGKADLALLDYANPSFNGLVHILFGNGTGQFPTKNSFTVGIAPENLCSADFNGDGNFDIATVSSSSNNISVLLGDGTGNFSTHNDFIIGSNPVSITSGDFNGDGKIDLAAANDVSGGPDSVWVLLGNGFGSFSTASKYLAGSGPYSVCSKDFNGDGFDDLAVANSNSNNVSVLLSNGASGLFSNAINYITGNGAPSSAPFSIVSEDFNFDGKPDLAIANFYQSIVYILIGTGNGTFGSSTYYPAHYGPWTIISADFNADGKPDLATANKDSPHSTVLINCSSIGIDENNNEKYYSIFPNPTTGKFNVETTTTGKQTIQVFDLNGKLVLNQNINNKAVIDATSLYEGIYNLTIKYNAGILIKKLIIVK